MAKVSVSKSFANQAFGDNRNVKERYGRLSDREKRLICVTSGNSYLGFHIVKDLLSHGYLVRVIIENQVDFEELKEKINDENILESVVVAKMKDLSSLCDAFRGSHAVFHTSSFIDPRGISGYSENMAFLEMEAANNVIEACGRASYVKRCVFTSSLLAAIWRGDDNVSGIIDESCWSNEEFCKENKLWLALGKTMSEKVSWNMAGELKVKLVTLCPALLIDSLCPNDLYMPYLKGSEEMLQQGTLATVDVKKVAEAHRHVYEALDYGANGRYLCFDTVNKTFNREIDQEIQSNLNNSKLAKLIFDQTFRHFSCNT